MLMNYYPHLKLEQMNYVQRLSALGLSLTLAEKLAKLFDLWVSCSGPEWTVSRLKSLKVELVSSLAGSPVRAQWISRNSEGSPKGPISELFRMANKSARGRFLAVNSLMIYSSLVSDKVTESQKRKFFDSMESKDLTGLQEVCQPKVQFRKVSKKLPLVDLLPWTQMPVSSLSMQPGPDGKSYPETDHVVSLIGAICSDPILKLTRKYDSLFRKVVPMNHLQDLWFTTAVRKKFRTPLISECVGKISYIQEPGFKLRAVANPNRILQAVLEPLKEVLGKALRSLPNDFTFGQDTGVKRVQEWLKEGRTCWSVDLSDATNLFPRVYTGSVLKHKVSVLRDYQEEYNQLVDLFLEVASLPWYAKDSSGRVTVHRFTRGQPLGLGPSFFAFAISHHALLRDICSNLEITNPDCYAILGDDIVISHSAVAGEYFRQLNILGCKVSKEKSLISSTVAEFAGKLILKDEVIPQYKWRELDDANVVDFCRNIGPKSLTLLSRRQRNLVEFLGPLPDFVGGLGWNPEGLTLEQRMKLPLVAFLLEKDLTVLMPFRRVDVGLTEVALDSRLLSLAPMPDSIGSLRGIIPTRDGLSPEWSDGKFWAVWRKAQCSFLPHYSSFRTDSELQYFRLFSGYYSPYFKGDGKPGKSVHQTPWFDVIRYFTRNQSRLVTSL